MTTSLKTAPSRELVARAEVRLFGLFLQAAHREAMLPQERFREEGGTLSWCSGELSLKVPGQSYAGGQRLRVSALAEEDGRRLSFEESLAKVGALSGWSGSDKLWRAAVEEMQDGVAVQAAAYQAALERPEPSNWQTYECWTPEGHNLHPGAKTRGGFSEGDQHAYSPDFALALELPWISVDKSLLLTSGEVPELFDLGDRWALPVHPWQRREILPKVYAEEWESGAIQDLDRPKVEATLSTSLRTVAPVDPELPILKLSVGSLMTSTERSMSRHTVLQGPVFSEILRRVFERKPAWSSDVELMDELGGLCWREPDAPNGRSRQLSLLFRRRPEIPDGWTAVPSSSLPQPCGENLDSRLWREFFSRGEGPIANFRRYCDLLIPLHLGLMTEAGIALEAHLQNCLVLWSEERPEALWVRDWGGLRADSHRIEALFPDLWPSLDPDSLTLTDGVKARRKLLANLYSNHLTEVVVGLCEEFGLAESVLWKVVKEISAVSLESAQDSELALDILQRPWPVKSLLRLRLGAEGEDYRTLTNPLSDVNLLVTSSLDSVQASPIDSARFT